MASEEKGPSPVKLGGKSLKLIILGAVLVAILGWVGGVYNGLVSSREAVDASWAAVESDYQRRSDLVPNLVETVKGAANFEQETLTQVTEARARATSTTVNLDDASSIQAFNQNQRELSSALSRLLVSVEAYPTLTATQNFKDLQVQLEGTENRISVSRKDYNDVARSYNTKRNQFPGSIVASIFGFKERTYFEAQEGADIAPTVNFGDN